MKNKFNKRNFIPGLIASPFVFALLFLTHNFFVFNRFWHYMKFGGEYINFEKNEKHTINEIFNMLKEMNEKKSV